MKIDIFTGGIWKSQTVELNQARNIATDLCDHVILAPGYAWKIEPLDGIFQINHDDNGTMIIERGTKRTMAAFMPVDIEMTRKEESGPYGTGGVCVTCLAKVDDRDIIFAEGIKKTVEFPIFPGQKLHLTCKAAWEIHVVEDTCAFLCPEDPDNFSGIAFGKSCAFCMSSKDMVFTVPLGMPGMLKLKVVSR